MWWAWHPTPTAYRLERRERQPGPPTREELLEALEDDAHDEDDAEAAEAAETTGEQAARREKLPAHPVPRILLDEEARDGLSPLAAKGLAEAAGRQRRE